MFCTIYFEKLKFEEENLYTNLYSDLRNYVHHLMLAVAAEYVAKFEELMDMLECVKAMFRKVLVSTVFTGLVVMCIVLVCCLCVLRSLTFVKI